MARLFITDREVALINRITRELIQHVVGQEIIYHGISAEHSAPHDVYNEAPEKVQLPPVRINALVAYDNPNVDSTSFTSDSHYTLEVYIHDAELQDRNVRPRDGDFVEYGRIFYEITSVTKPQVVFGQINNKVMTKLVCVPAREGQFAAGGDSQLGIDRARPVETRVCDEE